MSFRIQIVHIYRGYTLKCSELCCGGIRCQNGTDLSRPTALYLDQTSHEQGLEDKNQFPYFPI
jgi:hypothetical protein